MSKHFAVVSALSSAVLLAGGVFVYSASTANTACAANLGCCMERINENAPWVQMPEETTIKDCKKRNAKEDDDDQILKSLGKIRWSIKC